MRVVLFRFSDAVMTLNVPHLPSVDAVDEDVNVAIDDGSSSVSLDSVSGNNSAPLSAVGGGDKAMTSEFRVSLERSEAPRETISEK